MFPIRDENPTVRTPIATIAIIAVTIFVWLFVQGAGNGFPMINSLCSYGLIPGELLGTVERGIRVPIADNMVCVLDGGKGVITLITHAFLHGSWFHIIGNLWFLWIFGDNVEDSMGAARFVMFYLLCGLAAAAAQIIADPSAPIPMVGASGAIGGVMGAYARLYPRAHVHTLIPLGFYVTTVALPAFVMLGYWFFIQVVSGIPSLSGPAGGVAFWAHVGGFLGGLFLVGPMHRREYLEQHRRQRPRQSARYRF